MTEQAEHPKGTPENPLTRDDVLRLREGFLARLERRLMAGDSEAGLTLDLSSSNLKSVQLDGEAFGGYVSETGGVLLGEYSGAIPRGWHRWRTNLQNTRLERASLQKAYLVQADLRGAYLLAATLQGADFTAANLREANLARANLQGANLESANLQRANLWGANLQQADLMEADLEEANLAYAEFQGANLRLASWQEARGLDDASWGNHILGQEISRWHDVAADDYRKLKTWHTQRGLYDRAGEFFYREMECKRKGTSFRQNPGQWLWLNLLWGPLGYGEKPGRVVGYGILVWLLFAAAYWAAGLFWGLVTPDPLFALYLSAVSFTAVGYGPWIATNATQGWVQGLAAFESFVGVFMIAVFVTTFVRKMTR